MARGTLNPEALRAPELPGQVSPGGVPEGRVGFDASPTRGVVAVQGGLMARLEQLESGSLARARVDAEDRAWQAGTTAGAAR